jgi:glutaredoxin 3
MSLTSPRWPADVVIFRTPFCPYCTWAARLFERKGVAVREIDVSGNQDCRDWLFAETGMRTVPQIFINGRSVRGFEDVAALEKQGELDRLLREPPSNDSVLASPCVG